MHDRRPRVLAATLLASLVPAMLLAVTILASPALAQAGLSHLEDASTPPKGLLRLRAITAWTRYDSRFAQGGVAALGAKFTAESLGVSKVPELFGIASRVEAASGLPFTLTMGRARFDATAREEIVPVALEYGVTDRFAVGVMMPIVRKRIATLFRIDTAGSAANIGPNPNRTAAAAQQNNALVQAQFANAAAQLQACLNNPAGAGCAAVQGRETEAQQLIQASQSFANDLAALYGGATGGGLAFVPMTSSAAQTAIMLRVSTFNVGYQSLLGASLIQAVPTAAGGPAGPIDFGSFIVNDLGGDSLGTQERVGIGDLEVGFKWRALDLRRTATRRVGAQLAIAGSVRLPTGSRQSTSDFVDLSLGEGQVILDSRIVLDLQAGRLGLLAAGQFAGSSPARDTTTPPQPRPNARWADVQVAPRWHFSAPFSVHGAYSIRYTESTGDQLVGGGVSYSTLSTYKGTGSLPIEMRFTHLEAVKGDPGRPKFFRDQIELRIYYRLRR